MGGGGGFKFVTKELIGMTTLLIVAFLVLTHATGFARAVSAGGSTWVRLIKAFQGR